MRRAEPGRSHARANGADAAVVLTAAVTATGLLLPWPRTGATMTALFGAALAGLAIIAWLEHVGVRASTAVVVATCAVVLVVAVAVPPRRSADLWAYAAYGSVSAAHHGSPYVHRPAEYPDDPLVQRMAAGWRQSRSVYGPVFTALSWGVVRTTGGRPLPTRLLFQGLAALAVAAALVVLSVRVRSRAGIAVVGLHPLTIIYVVNGGHNDALVAALLVAAAVVARRRPVTAAALIAVAAGIKAVALLAACGLACWLWHQRRRREAVMAGTVAVALVGASILLAGGGAAVSPLLAATGRTSRASVWALAPGLAGQGLVAATPVFVVAVAFGALAARHREPAVAISAGLVAYLLAGRYVLPSYWIWVMPLAAIGVDTMRRRVIALVTTLTVLAYQYTPHNDSTMNALLRVGVGVTRLGALTSIALLSLSMSRIGPRSRGAGRSRGQEVPDVVRSVPIR